jgi:hypothetical protein
MKKAVGIVICLVLLSASVVKGYASDRISLAHAAIAVSPQEPSYIRRAAQDLQAYLTAASGNQVPVLTTGTLPGAPTVIIVGKEMAASQHVKLGSSAGQTTLSASTHAGQTVIVVAGLDPHDTNMGLATFLQMIKVDGKLPYVDAPLDQHIVPNFAVRGIHLNGWPLAYPYAFRSWKEADWKRFIDIAWSERINLFYLWPFMEIIPTPLSAEDSAYLQEVHRVIEYAQQERGMTVWIMQSANRIALTDCGVKDPRSRAYWINGCQKDMNPADDLQFARIQKAFDAFYQIVNNADGYVFIDSDPGGWPQSPISDQLKIFMAARKILDRYSTKGSQAELIDWMHVGWGRHKLFTSTDSVLGSYDFSEPDESDNAFMTRTMRNFKDHLPEPWQLIAGQPPYLDPVKQESLLGKTVYLPYGAIEDEPAFPATNIDQKRVAAVFDRAEKYPGLLGVMGNNQLMLLQFPGTYYFFQTAWDKTYEHRSEREVLLDLAESLYPDQQELIADSFLALRETDADHIQKCLDRLAKVVESGDIGRLGPTGRFLFPDALSVARNLEKQLQIRAARQTLLKALNGKPDIQECSRLMENYFDKLLAWNKETGWNKMIAIDVWTGPIYEQGKDLTAALSRLKQLLAQGEPYTSYPQIDGFFRKISGDLESRYDADSVMIGCVEPMKLAVIQND